MLSIFANSPIKYNARLNFPNRHKKLNYDIMMIENCSTYLWLYFIILKAFISNILYLHGIVRPNSNAYRQLSFVIVYHLKYMKHTLDKLVIFQTPNRWWFRYTPPSNSLLLLLHTSTNDSVIVWSTHPGSFIWPGVLTLWCQGRRIWWLWWDILCCENWTLAWTDAQEHYRDT